MNLVKIAKSVIALESFEEKARRLARVYIESAPQELRSSLLEQMKKARWEFKEDLDDAWIEASFELPTSSAAFLVDVQASPLRHSITLKDIDFSSMSPDFAGLTEQEFDSNAYDSEFMEHDWASVMRWLGESIDLESLAEDKMYDMAYSQEP